VPTVGHCYPDASSTIVWINGSGSTQNNPAVMANRIKAVREQIRQHLPQFSGHAHDV
jgi:hypothetical protein